jgi:(p)ppGpp synthase/HD superfamily hydrolase
MVEDTNATLKELKDIFGYEVADLVNYLTRQRRKNESEKSKQQTKIKHLLKFFKYDYKQARLLKTTDSLDNLRSYEFITNEELKNKKLKRWYNEVKNYGLKLAMLADKRIAKDMNEVLTRYIKIGLFKF